MKKYIIYSILICSLTLFSNSCGISKEVRSASSNLVQKQKESLEAHQTFHKAVIKTLNKVLDAEQAKSDGDYNDDITNYHESMLETLKKIYSDATLSEADKKVKEEKARQKIMKYLLKAEENRAKRDGYIKQAKNNLTSASFYLIEGEKAKSVAIEKLDEYLQTERPTERLLNEIGIDLDNYTSYITKANEAIKIAEPYIDKLKK
jgi:hypothetical protein